MIPEELIDYLAKSIQAAKKELIEKDLYLQILLLEFSKNEYFRKNFVFKGGTCLIKHYLGYYRFSEDLDFTWICQSKFKNKTEKQIRKELSKEVAHLIDMLHEISKRADLDFKPEKHNKKYVEFGGSNKFITFKLWYTSQVLNLESFIKIQINFVELFLYDFHKADLKTIADDADNEELKFLFPEQYFLFNKANLLVYDIKEIGAEKVRAILTRRGIKARDFVDLYLINKKTGIFRLKNSIIKKVKFMLGYEKYLFNLKEKDLNIKFKEDYKQLMLINLDDGFTVFVDELYDFLKTLKKDIIDTEKNNKKR